MNHEFTRVRANSSNFSLQFAIVAVHFATLALPSVSANAILPLHALIHFASCHRANYSASQSEGHCNLHSCHDTQRYGNVHYCCGERSHQCLTPLQSYILCYNPKSKVQQFVTLLDHFSRQIFKNLFQHPHIHTLSLTSLPIHTLHSWHHAAG